MTTFEQATEKLKQAIGRGTYRRVTTSVAGPRFAFSAGQILRLDAGTWPAGLVAVSEPWTPPEGQPLPKNIAPIDGTTWARVSTPPPEADDRPVRLTPEQICQRFGWSRDELTEVQGYGFPRYAGTRADEFGRQSSTWSASDVDRWADTVRRLFASVMD